VKFGGKISLRGGEKEQNIPEEKFRMPRRFVLSFRENGPKSVLPEEQTLSRRAASHCGSGVGSQLPMR